MEKFHKRSLWKRTLCFVLSFLMAFSTFITMTVSNSKYLDIIHIRNIITAYADDETLPQFYREGELVGIYNPDYTSTDTIYYKIGENGTWTEYKVPVAIPVFTTSTVYARIGANGTINGDDFASSKLGIGNYTEETTDYILSYNGLDFNFTRTYNSKDDVWQMPFNYQIKRCNNSTLKTRLFDGNEYTFIRVDENDYYNELSGYHITKQTINANTFYVIEIDGIEYYYRCYSNYIYSHLSKVKDKYGNEFTINTTDDYTYITDGAGRRYYFAQGANSVIDITDEYELDDDFLQIVNTSDPNNNAIKYIFIPRQGVLGDYDRLGAIVDQTDTMTFKYHYSNNKLTKSNDKTINYNSDGRVSSIVYDSGEAITYTYNDTEKTYIERSNQGGSTTTVYNDAFLPVSVSDGITTTTYTYDSKYRLATETTDSVTITYTYDNNGNLVSSVSSDTENGVNTYYTYYSNGKVKREQCGDDYTYYVYNANGDVTVSATLKENYTGTVPAEYDSTLTCFDITEYTYDNSGRLTEETSDDSTESYTYDQYGNRTSVETEYTENNETVTEQTEYTYDILGNVLTATQDNETTTYTYDEAGRTLLVNENGKCTRTLYDNLGRIVQEISPEDYDSAKEGLPNANTYADSNVGQRYHYNNNNQVDYEINRLHVRTDYTYHTNGVKATENFDIYNYSYNPQGNVTEVEIDGATTPYAVYNYDTTGLVLQSIDYGNGQTVLYEYNNDGKVEKQKYKEAANASPVTQFVYEYDVDGELCVKIDLNSQRYTEYSENTVTVSNLVTTQSNNETVYSAGTLIYSYADTEEVRNESTNELTTPSTATKVYNDNTVGITYNDNNTVYTLNHNSLFNIAQTNDETNHTSSSVIRDSSNNTILANSYTYDSNNNITSMTSGNIETSYVYDSNNRITEYHQGNEAAYYTYDSTGQLIREDLNYSGYQKTFTYTYDNRGNITKVKEYEYSRGSLMELEDVTKMDFEYEDEVWLDEIDNISQYEFIYDENGNPIDISGLNLNWTNGRQLESVSFTAYNQEYPVSSYIYDDNGIRTKRTEWNTTTYYTTEDGTITSQYELDNQGNKQNEMIFVYDNDEPVAILYNGYQYYYEKNAMGDVIAIVDEDGDTIVSYRYDAWGNEVRRIFGSSSCEEDSYVACQNPFRYRSYYYDDDGFGAYYLQSRYFESEFLRFLNADIPKIAQQSKSTINGLNLFTYCYNDPVNIVDEMGMFPIIASLIIGALSGIITLYFVDVIFNMIQKVSQWWKATSSVSDYIASGLLGAISSLSITKRSAIIITTIISGASYIANCIEHGTNVNLFYLVLSLVVGAFCGAISGSGINLKKKIGIIQTSEYKLNTLISAKKITQYTNKIVNNTYGIIVGFVRLKISTAVGGIINKIQQKYGKTIANKIKSKLKKYNLGV